MCIFFRVYCIIISSKPTIIYHTKTTPFSYLLCSKSEAFLYLGYFRKSIHMLCLFYFSITFYCMTSLFYSSDYSKIYSQQNILFLSNFGTNSLTICLDLKINVLLIKFSQSKIVYVRLS